MDESQEQVTLGNINNGNTIVNHDHKCKLSHEPFENLQDALRHELLQHTEIKNKKNTVGNQLKRRINAVFKTINAVDEKKFRQELSEAISDCAIGTELNVIFKKYKLDSDDLEFIFSRINSCLQQELNKIGNFSIHPYGSIANGLALKTSDIDLHISCQASQVNSNTVFKNITRMLFSSKCFSDVHPIRKARVPIIKCVHKTTGFSIDINTSEPFGVHNSKFIEQLIECDRRIYDLILFIKIWSKSMHIYGAFNLTNYCLITLVIFFLQNSSPPVLDAIKILQRNSTKRIINGVNFGVNTRYIPTDTSQNIHQLIKGFFQFYHAFDFVNFIIAPYLGKAINRTDFENKVFKYPEYEKQLLSFANAEEDIGLQTNRPVCVQDMFCLNINVGKCLSETNIQYFKKCVALAHSHCSEPKISQKNLYKSLLVGIIEEIIEIFPENKPDTTNDSASTMKFDILPRRNELKSLAKFASNPLDLNKLWAKEYVDAIVQIITEVYRIDMTILSPTQNTKFKKVDKADEEASPRPSKWILSCYVDLWSGRQMQRNNSVPFMEYQLKQTEKLHAERRQNSKFAVQFKGNLTICIANNYSVIHLNASSTETVCKKDPLRKFFGMLKCSLQNFNLKQRIHELELQTKEQPN